MKKRNDFAIYVISHQKAQGNAADWLSANSSYPVYVVIDDQDKQIAEYKRRYPNVVVFDKEAVYQATDTMDNFHHLTCAVYARNAVLNHARQMGFRYFLLSDDDITAVFLRYEKGGKIKSVRIESGLDETLEAMLDFMDCSDTISILSASSQFKLIGNGFRNNRLYHDMTSWYIEKTANSVQYRGTHDEDRIYIYDSAVRGGVPLGTSHIMMAMPERGDNNSGIDYPEMYIVNSYPLMAHPSFNEIVNGKLRCDWGAAIPKILSGSYRKETT